MPHPRVTTPSNGRRWAIWLAGGTLSVAVTATAAACTAPESPGTPPAATVIDGGLDARQYCANHGFTEADLSDTTHVLCLTALTTDDLEAACKREDPTTTDFHFQSEVNAYSGTCVVAAGTKGISDMMGYCQDKMTSVPPTWRDRLAFRPARTYPFWQCYTDVDPSAICVAQIGNTLARAQNVNGSWACAKPADPATPPATR